MSSLYKFKYQFMHVRILKNSILYAMEFKKNDCISNNFSFNNTLYKRRFTFLPVKIISLEL